MFQGRSSTRTAAPVVLTSVLAWCAATALAQSQAPASTTPAKTPDAQIEANVLKALAAASDLANQPITTSTVYGVVTLSGSVETEAQRSEAETIASRTMGVAKVVDELTLGSQPAAAPAQAGSPLPGSAAETNSTPQPEATVAPHPQDAPAASQPDNQPGSQSGNSAPLSSGPSYGPGAPEYQQPGPGTYPQQGYPQQQSSYPQQGYPQQAPQGPQGYPPQPPNYGPPSGQPGYPQGNRPYSSPGYYGGQAAGESVTIPSGAMIRIRINQTLDSGRTQPGTTFDGTVVNDVVAGGAIAIPRGATVQGAVVDATRSGVLAGRGEMSLQLTQVFLGGRSYPITSDIWAHHGGDKTIQSVNSTAVGTGMGALVGAAAGGGVGAAIGAGVGGALGLGASAASGSGQVYIPSEGMLTFHLAQPVTVATVSQEEMNRLAQGAGLGAEPPRMQRRYYAYPAPYPYPYPYPYYGPVYYRHYYYPYRY